MKPKVCLADRPNTVPYVQRVTRYGATKLKTKLKKLLAYENQTSSTKMRTFEDNKCCRFIYLNLKHVLEFRINGRNESSVGLRHGMSGQPLTICPALNRFCDCRLQKPGIHCLLPGKGRRCWGGGVKQKHLISLTGCREG